MTFYVLLTIANIKLLKTMSQTTKHHEISCNMSYWKINKYIWVVYLLFNAGWVRVMFLKYSFTNTKATGSLFFPSGFQQERLGNTITSQTSHVAVSAAKTLHRNNEVSSVATGTSLQQRSQHILAFFYRKPQWQKVCGEPKVVWEPSDMLSCRKVCTHNHSFNTWTHLWHVNCPQTGC